ncbi:uncharacterized protein [Henckelia pumila]|uniref:uncharacterized protein n=1 Tax=Henckelia pumila TaxID=405737 RepID=UPI003C6DC9D7
MHTVQCMWGTNVCFLCKKQGHHQKDCPQSKEQVKGRVFAMNHDQVDPDSTIITVMICISSFLALVLIDTGATHSFISVKFVIKLGIVPKESALGFIVSFPSGEELKSNRVHETTIDYKKRTVSLKIQNGNPFVFYATPKTSLLLVISASNAWKLMNKGCTGFLASIICERELPRPKLEEVVAVRDFSEVFPDDVAGLPPAKEVEFGIELVPGTKPASKAPYRLAPMKMKELKVQLQEILDKGFIRPSVLSWGAPFFIDFIDDILIYFRNMDEHCQHLTTVLKILKEKRLFAKFSNFRKRNEVDPSKVEAVRNWVAPKNATEMQSFLGLAGLKFEWSDQCEKSFVELKERLIIAPVLAILEGTGRFVVYTDASKSGLGDFLMQDDKVKVEHQRPVGLLKPLPFPTRKWEDVSMDFVVGLLVTTQRMNSIWVIVDRLTKLAHFLSVRNKFSMNQYTELYIREIVRLHGVPARIMSDIDPKFTLNFWGSLHQGLGTKLALSIAFHPQTDVEFTYNNSYQETIGVTPYEVLYGRRCKTPLHWDEFGERAVLGPEIVAQTVDLVANIRDKMLTA